MLNVVGPPHGPAHCSTTPYQCLIVVSELCQSCSQLQLQLEPPFENMIPMVNVMSNQFLIPQFQLQSNVVNITLIANLIFVTAFYKRKFSGDSNQRCPT